MALTVTFALAGFKPVTVGGAAGCVWPAGITTLVVDNPTTVASLVASASVTFAAGGAGKVIKRGADWPRLTSIDAGVPMPPRLCTVTASVAGVMFGFAEEAVMVVWPAANPVTAILMFVAFAGMIRDAGTVAAAGLLETRFTTKPPAGAGVESLSVTDGAAPTGTTKLATEKLSTAPTLTVPVAGRYPGADTVIVVLPNATPLTCG